MAETIFACLRRLQADWAEEIGQDRFEIFLGVLGELAARAEKAKETEQRALKAARVILQRHKMR